MAINPASRRAYGIDTSEKGKPVPGVIDVEGVSVRLLLSSKLCVSHRSRGTDPNVYSCDCSIQRDFTLFLCTLVNRVKFVYKVPPT